LEKDWFDFKSEYGNFAGARDAFEKACEALFRKMYASENVQPVKVKQGDGGIDIFIGKIGIEPIDVIQCKFFLDEFEESQKSQIRRSFKVAIESQKYDMSSWTLCIPRILDSKENKWWSEWTSKKIIENNLDSAFLKIKTGNHLIDLMKEYSVYNQVFKMEDSLLIKDTNEKVTKEFRLNVYPFRPITKNILPEEINIEYKDFTFTQKEKSILTSIENKLLFSNDKFVYIKSAPGLGKTILALKAGLKLENNELLILFISLDQKDTDLVKKLIEINAKAESDVVCILTNCHLNFQQLKKIHLYKNEYKNIKFICEFRSIKQNDTIPFDLLELINKRNVYDLDFEEIEFVNKYRGIIEHYNPNLLLTNKQIKRIIELTGWNFIILNQLLKYSKSDKYLMIEFDNALFLKFIYNYFKNCSKDLRLFATINEYEIAVNCDVIVEKVWFKDFLNRNLIISEQSSYFRFYHSDFATILIKSYYSNNEFDNKNKELYEYEQFKNFILITNNDYTRLYEIFDRLYSNNANTVLFSLLNDKEIINYALEYYNNPSKFSSTNIAVEYSKLLKIINKIMPSDIFNVYFSSFVIDNDKFVNLNKTNPQAILSLAEISLLLNNSTEQQKEIFKNTALKILHLNYDYISFLELCNILFILHKHNSYLYSNYIEVFNDKLLVQKALQERLVPLSKGLKILSKIMNKSFSEDIFSRVDKEILSINLQNDNIKDSLVAFNVLKEYDYTKTYNNFNIKNLNIEFSNYNLSNIVDIMIEIMKFSSSHEVRDYFSRKLTFELLSDKIKNEELPIIANQLIRLYKFCIAIKDTIVNIIQSISIEDFSIKSKYLTISEIEIILNQFSKIENEPYTHTKKLLRNMNDEWFILKFHSSSISNILNSMALLMKIEPDFIKNKYSNFETSISERIDGLSFEEHIKILPYLYKFSSKRAFEILIYLIKDSSKLKNWYQSLNYQAISKNLRFFQKIENGSNTNLNENVVYNFFCSFDNDFYSAKILDYEFGLLCNFSLIISRINASYKKSILRVFSKISNSQLDDKINSSSFLKVINGLVNLHQIDKNITNNVFNYSYNSLITIANKANILDFTIGLNTLKNRIPEYSNKIYTDNRIKVEHLAIQCNNSDLIEIKKYVYFLKNINLNKTVKFIECLDNNNIVFKFTNDRSFDKASNLLRDIHLINKSKIEKVLEMMDKDKLFEMCLESIFKVVIQGLSKITEINSSIAKTIFQKYKHQIDINRELLQISNFQNLSQKMREIVKIEDSKITTSDFINKIGESYFINLAKRSSVKSTLT